MGGKYISQYLIDLLTKEVKTIKHQENSFADAARLIKDVWRHRDFTLSLFGREIKEITNPIPGPWKGKTFHLEHELPGTILDTIDVLWPEPRPRPLLTHKKRTPTGWHLIFTLPPGISFSDVAKKQEYFSDATRTQVAIERKGGYLHMSITAGEMKTYYQYEWDPAPFKDMDLPVPIGYTPAGLVVADLAALPHMRIGGTAFTGKSNCLHTLFISLAMLPNVLLAVIDLALLEFSYVKDYAAFASDTPTALTLLRALEKEMHRRRRVLDAAGVVKIQEYRGDDLPFIVLIVDEYSFVNPKGTFDKEEKELRKECQATCSNLAALARKVGIHLVLAMQRPDMDILPGQLKANLPGAISFKTINQVNSEIILDNGAAAELPDIKGRAIWQVGNQQMEVQTMHLPVKRARKIISELRRESNVRRFFEPEKRLPAGPVSPGGHSDMSSLGHGAGKGSVLPGSVRPAEGPGKA